MPVELRVGVTVAGQHSSDINHNQEALGQADTHQTLVADNVKTNAESDMQFQYFSH